MPIYGTRPEAIKMAPVIAELETHGSFENVVTVTGQHREMLDQVNALFQIEPDYDLNVIEPRQTLTGITSAVLVGLDELLKRVRPEAVIVQGDTTSAMAGAMAAFYNQIPVVHLEAGLRSHNLALPFPEEGNRKIVGQLAALHLAPTETSRSNLLAEGADPGTIAVTGNTVIDALLHTQAIPLSNFTDPALAAVVASGKKILLVTTHRRENLGGGMRDIGDAVARLSKRLPNIEIVLPMHRNPLVREILIPILGDLENVLLTEPVQYHEFSHLMAASHVILTDSGGIQEEAPALGKPVLVMRDTTERPEAVSFGVARLIGTSAPAIESHVFELFDSETAYQAMSRSVNPYGDGNASRRSVAAIGSLFGVGQRLDDFVAKA
jgi:UDP-N-acetylglucosamine 2-epimerase (non-hydrolysing)